MKYIRTHIVDAEPMKFGEFKDKFPKSGGANVERDANDDGYVITYRKGEPNEYVSWCPKAEFDAVSKPMANMTFGQAIEAMKVGKKVARAGWNGKGMYLWLLPASSVKAEWCKEAHLKALAEQNGGEFECLGSIRMKTADNKVLTGWLASQTDMLSEDWVIVD
ncbi:MAG: DUF2829 domain-containing protein [Kiritimatiellae bacterium]|nr:DUF2829 domain-containing protein [Kiritimatiellia bacterium]